MDVLVEDKRRGKNLRSTCLAENCANPVPVKTVVQKRDEKEEKKKTTPKMFGQKRNKKKRADNGTWVVI